MPAAEPTPVAPQPARAPEPAAQPDPPARHTASAPHRAPPASNAPLSLSPNAVAPAPVAAAPPPPARTAARSDAAAVGGYAVQISSRRNEAEAEAAFRTLQAKFPGQLGGRQPLIRRVDLGEKGVYYRAMVGPFGNADEASKLCSDLKAAGGSCFVQRI
jgi:cell division protein FtsN